MIDILKFDLYVDRDQHVQQLSQILIEKKLKWSCQADG